MPKVRKLFYQNGKVQQPYFNGTKLKKWIHDGKVVWQNGGGDFKNLIFSTHNYTVYGTGKLSCLDIKEKKAYTYYPNVYVTNYALDGLIATFSSIGYRYAWVTDDYTMEDNKQFDAPRSYSNLTVIDSNTMLGTPNTNIADEKTDLYRLSLESGSVTDEKICHIDVDSKYTYGLVLHGSNLVGQNKIFVGFKRGEYNGGTFWIYPQCINIIDEDGNETEVAYFEHRDQIGYVSNSVGQWVNGIRRIDVNGITYFICGYGEKPVLSTSGVPEEFGFMKYKNGNATFIHRPIPSNYQYFTPDNLIGLRYYNGSYYAYFSEKYYPSIWFTSPVYGLRCVKVNENLEPLGAVEIPERIDLKIENATSSDDYDTMILWREGCEHSGIPERCMEVYMTSLVGPNIVFDNKGEVSDSPTIDHGWMYSSQRRCPYVHIDNIFFDKSEGNFAVYSE